MPASNGSTATCLASSASSGHPALGVAPAVVLALEARLAEVEPRPAAGERLEPELDQRRALVDRLARVAPAPRQPGHRLERPRSGRARGRSPRTRASHRRPRRRSSCARCPNHARELAVVGQGAPQALRRGPEVELAVDGGDGRGGHVTPLRGGGAARPGARPRPRRMASATSSTACSGAGSSSWSRSRPSRRTRTRPASRRTSRCLVTAWRVIGSPSPSAWIEAAPPWRRRSSSTRRVGSATATKTASMSPAMICNQ